MGVKSVDSKNLDASVVFQPTAPDGVTLNVVEDTSYLIIGDPAEIVLPPIDTCLGRRLTITFGTPLNRVAAANPLTPILWAGQTVNEIFPLNAGTYEFRAVAFSANSTWVVLATEGSRGRSNIDIAYINPGELPVGFDIQPAGSAGRYTVNGTIGSQQPVSDSNTPYLPGQIVAYPFADPGVGLYLVRKNNGPEDWQLESLPVEFDASSGTDYRVLGGDVYGGRVLSRYAEALFQLDRLALQCWPRDGSQLDGTTDPLFDTSRFNNELIFGKINLITQNLSNMDFTLVCPNPLKIADQRFALKVVDAGTAVFTLTGPALPGQIGAAASISANPETGIFTVAGLTGMTSDSVGRSLTLSGGDTGTNGTHKIVGFTDANTVDISNPDGVFPDSNSGAITWYEKAVPSYTVENPGNIAAAPDTLIQFTLSQGMYVEWVMDPNGVWRVVASYG